MTPSLPRPARALAVAAAITSCPFAGPAVAAESPVPGASAPGVSAPADQAIVGGTPAGLDTRVVGGDRTSIVDWPSVVALLNPGELSVPWNRQFCGGTVIASRWVLTAAHCLYDAFRAPMDAADMTVLVGQTNLRDPSEGRELLVTAVYRHPGYVHGDTGETGRTRDDIALLELATPIPAPSSELFAGDPADYPGEGAVIVGWGATEYVEIGQPPFPDELRRASVPLVPLATCNAPDAYDGEVVEGQFCAGFAEGGVDSCTGDSGGPLYVRIDERVQLAGVTSFGRGCALPDFYGIYTDVSAYRDWIRQYVTLPNPAPRVPQSGAPAGDDEGVSGGAAAGAGGPLALVLGGIVAWRRRDRDRARTASRA